jgi:hypothetical protein
MKPIVIDTVSYLGISMAACVAILEEIRYKHGRVHIFAGAVDDPDGETIEIVKLDHNFYCYIVTKLKIHFAAKSYIKF